MERAPSPGDLLIFYNPYNKKYIDETGCNQVGVYLSENEIVFSQNGKAMALSLSEIDGITNDIKLLQSADTALMEKVVKFFTINKNNVKLIEVGLRSLKDKHIIFDNPNLMPDVRNGLSSNELQQGWERVYPKIKPIDSIFIFNTKSIISKTISKVDNGSWSHVGTYLGEGKIIEAVTSGTRIADICIYKENHIRMGVYRLIGITNEDREELIKEYLKRGTGRKYNYKGVFRLGLKKIFQKDFIIKEPRDTEGIEKMQ